MNANPSSDRLSLPWIEIALGVALVALGFQLFPAAWWTMLRAFDLRNWTWGARFLGTVIVLFVLVSIKWSPGLWDDYQERKKQRSEVRQKAEQLKSARERKQRIEGIKEGRWRRLS
ncbi:hypothetical protein Pla111_30630 [Botrimarina hoheduenensis]|uniref:Uncharacterized protein n=1 Tax=Botrimarina hoheduenensis TaxID=2528000 RepID=A0A5C5VUM9_9BACT|nr:hypothetical protein Pla111_30630 [Botrimarina hoheduenensis]